jgi:hypothetical protein
MNHIISSNIYKNSISKWFDSSVYKIEIHKANQTSSINFQFSLVCQFNQFFLSYILNIEKTVKKNLFK